MTISAMLHCKAVLRHDKNYFDRHIAFNAKRCHAIELCAEQYVVLEDIAGCPMEAQAAQFLFDAFSEVNGVTYQSLLDDDILEEAEITANASRHSALPQAISKHPIPTASSPTQIELCITRRCNQGCVHCNVSAVGIKQKEKAEVGFWKDIIHQCVNAKVLKVTVTGGEPFIREGFLDIYNCLADAPIAASILTNATSIPEHLMPVIAENGHTLSVSLDGTSPEVHDDFRKMPGAFEITLQTMRKLSQHGITFTINTVLHQNNIRHIERILQISEEVGAKAVVATPLGAVGRGASLSTKSYYPDMGEYNWAMSELERLAKETNSESSVALLNPDKRELIEIQRKPGSTPMSRRPPEYCKAGVYAMAIDEDGLAYSCLRGLQERMYPIGDAKEMSLIELWNADSWSPFRGSSDRRVPCRVEDINANPDLYQIDVVELPHKK